MIHHIVLFKFKKDISKENIDLLYENFLKLKDEIPWIVSITWGIDISIEEKAKWYNIAFLLIFENKKDRDDYLPHPKHQSLVEKYILPIIEDVLVFDYENSGIS
jgi:hypothetical protein